MDPFGHHHHRRDDDNREEEFPPPGRRYDEPPPPPQVSHVYHTSHLGGPPPMNMESNYVRPNYPPPQMDNNYGRPNQPQMDNNYERPNYGGSYSPPSDYSSVEHVSHESESVHDDHHHRFQPHVPSFFHRQTSSDPKLIDKPSFRVYTKADTNYSLTIRDGKVVLASNDLSDPFQHWYKDERYSTKVKDEEGFPSFALVNKAAGLVIKHSLLAPLTLFEIIFATEDRLNEHLWAVLSRSTI
ncbi:hypothetical protein K7X08_026139 [Anisodus acutangulus]|uniref:Uncharacterized protein n=1 Tax=Anisodus acutangulus TaxID=402998 RepID=A0A9Q1N257_9SOLA|nr:hypothetical protein K7X08_026139 [Anisodus acutangulus]